MQLRSPVVSSPHNDETRSTDYKGLRGRCTQKVLCKWLEDAVAGLPLRPEIHRTDIVVMLQLRHCSLLHTCQESLMFNNFTSKIISNSILILLQSV